MHLLKSNPPKRIISYTTTSTKEPQKLPLKIKLSRYTSRLTPEKLALVHEIQKLLENESFIWGDFPMDLPESRLNKTELKVDVDDDESSIIDLNKLFLPPDFSIQSELEKVGRNKNGTPKRLSNEQLIQIFEKAILTVSFSLLYSHFILTFFSSSSFSIFSLLTILVPTSFRFSYSLLPLFSSPSPLFSAPIPSRPLSPLLSSRVTR